MASWRVSLGLTLAIGAATAAWAQSPPTPLLGPQPGPSPVPQPGPPGARPAGPAIRIDPPAGALPTPLPQERTARPRPPTVTSRPLPALDHESAGWNRAEGGFPPTLWQGSGWANAGRLLERLPAPAGTPARHALARRLLMSAVARPDGAPAGAFLERRLAGLLALGDGAAAMALVRAVPEARLDGPRARPAAEAGLAGGAAADSCKLARRAEIDLTDLFWRRLLLACDAVDGHAERVRVGLDLLRDQGIDPGRAFTALVEGAVGLGDKPASLADLDPVTTFLALHAGVPIDAAAVARASPATLAVVARADRLPIEMRLAAGERAAMLGLIDGAQLAGLYAGLPVTPERLSDAVTDAGRHPGADGRAVLFQAARLELVPARRLERLAAGWQHARHGGAALAYGAAAAPLVREIAPSLDLAEHAPAAIRIALAVGDSRTAMRWLTLIGRRPGDERAMAAQAAAAPLLRLALGEDGPAWNAEAVARWSAGMGGPAAPSTAIGLALLASLGDLAASDQWIALSQDPAGPTAAVRASVTAIWFAQEAAARESRQGEQVALALIALGRESVPHPLAAFSALNGLRLGEETAAARRIAVEIALQAGL
ncbi:hypothetical protein STVA_51140 [Allostella vacuolata]|nr:hypothetical protein STVA_51140 [Stella vacuolata]